ncbi:MAG: NAD(P)H-hydrate dehydratase [Rhabdochlamydiaceae bacterium]|nr:NAD(P)H-hydrate dehydratase [Rhabdochlamydiaceae bacterium]
MIEGIKVVTALEMSRIEGMAYAEGAVETEFMENAGKAIAQITEDFLRVNGLPKVVTLLVGKGNNGGDAYVAGRHLIERGHTVFAYHIYSLDTCGPLCRAMHERFTQAGGKVHFVRNEQAFHFEPQGMILDGLVGTGFHGKAEGVLAQAIVAANECHLPIIAIDIPSGVNGNTGAVETVAIHADLTIYLGLPKIGFFIGDGWNYIGQLQGACFGLKDSYIESAKAEGYLFPEEMIHDMLPPMHRTRHKYESGYVLGIAGSLEMPGAALLASTAALKSGAGIVRLFYPQGMEVELSAAPYELIREAWDREDDGRIQQEAARAKAAFIGPGMGRDKESKKAIKMLLSHLKIPCVIDADALYFLGESPSWKLPEHSVLTPHHGEMKQLLSGLKGRDPFTFSDVQEYVEKSRVTLILKGAPTLIFYPGKKPMIVTCGDPGMATAGSGDVLTGMVAGLIAQGMDPWEGAILAVALHGKAGELAARELTSYCMTASDLLTYLPLAFGKEG